MKRYYLILYVSFLFTAAYGLEIKVKSFSLSPLDMNGQKYYIMDDNSQKCALIKVQFPLSDIVISGKEVKKSVFKVNEHWCYVTIKAKDISLKFPDGVTVPVNITESLTSGCTYTLTFEFTQQMIDNYFSKLSPKELLELGLDAKERGERGTAVLFYKRGAELGNSECQYAMGICHEVGSGVSMNKEKAAYWYGKAARQNHIDACLALAFMYIEGEGVSVDKGKAINLLQICADAGNGDALTILGIAYIRGNGVEKNSEKAFSYFKQAANVGSIEGMSALGEYYEFELHDIDNAVIWYKKAAENGDEDAIEHLKRLNL